MKQKQYFLTSRHGNCGANVMFHNKDEKGYGTNTDNLQIYSAVEAQKRHDHYGRDSLPLLVDKVKEKTFLSVDHQYMDETANSSGSLGFIKHIPRQWNGNDGYWIDNDGRPTQDISKARVFYEKGNIQNLWCLEYIKSIARPVFQEKDINVRSMCRGVKLKRKERERSYREMSNCIVCGRFCSLDYTYATPLCSNHNESWKRSSEEDDKVINYAH